MATSGDQHPLDPYSGTDTPPAPHKPDELAAKERSDPNQTNDGEPESGAGYGNHAMPDVKTPAANE